MQQACDNNKLTVGGKKYKQVLTLGEKKKYKQVLTLGEKKNISKHSFQWLFLCSSIKQCLLQMN